MTRNRSGENGALAFPETIRNAVCAQVPELMGRFDPAGFFRPRVAGASVLYDSQFIYPLAYFYRTRFAGNPYCGDAEIFAATRQIGDDIAKRTLPSGRVAFESFGYTGETVDQRLLTFWLDAYLLVRDELTAATRRRWEAAMCRSLRHLAERIAGYLDQERFNCLSFGTSPNHASLYASTLLLGARLFGRDDWESLALTFMDRLAALQDPEGFWPEGDGPVTVYHTVSLAGMARVEALCSRAAYRTALAKSLEYCRKIRYRDGSWVTLIDGRQHYSGTPFAWGMFGHTHWPQGRAMLRETLRARLRLRQPMTGEEAARWLENYAHCRPGPAPRLAEWKGREFLGNYAAFFREGRWQLNFCTNAKVVNPNSPFRLGSGNVMSLWHEAAGVVVMDSQDKFRPGHCTFSTGPREDLGVFLGGRIGSLSCPPYVEASYANGLAGRVEAELTADGPIRLRAVEKAPANSRAGYRQRELIPVPELYFNLPLHVRHGETIAVAGRQYVLGRRKLEIAVAAGQKLAVPGRGILVVPGTDAVLHYPCKPFNPYARDNSAPPGSWFLRLACPMTGEPRAAAVEISVAACEPD